MKASRAASATMATRMQDGPMTIPPTLSFELTRPRCARPAGLTMPGGHGTNVVRRVRGNAVLEKGQPQRFNAYNSPHEDLREFIKRAEEAGEIVRIKGADWNLEMGTLGEIVNHARPEAPALLFEDVPGYPKGMRLISGATNSSKRLAITMG